MSSSFPDRTASTTPPRPSSDSATDAEFVWHTRTDLDGIDGVILPGGFAHGDYLRPGALARFSPVMAAVETFAADGGPVLGICNGFQVLVEAGLLPGALQKNRGLTFLCQPTTIVVASTASVLTCWRRSARSSTIPINHFSGSYTCDEETLAELERDDRSCCATRTTPTDRATTSRAWRTRRATSSGSMPHPERAMSTLLGSADGLVLFESFLGVEAAQPALAH